jgi:CheY-like chemotaxis protein
VDDKDHNLSMLVDFLTPLGFVMFTAQDGQEAFRQAQQQRPDLILMDMLMPTTSGAETIRQIRQQPEIKQTIIIGTSAGIDGFEKADGITNDLGAFHLS